MASDSLKLYGAIYAGLLVLAFLNWAFFETGSLFTYEQALVGALVIAVLKTVLIVAYFMHLRSENRSLTYLMGLALALALLLMAAATYSIS